MRKIFVFIIGGFITFSAFGVGENVPTSKSYIDSVLVNKQDAIERTAGANQALTNTGTAAEYGTKNIYDSNGSYTEQTDALVDAQTMNAAVQNAINAEFVCISWVDDDPTKDCLLMVLGNRNLFNISKNPIESGNIYSGDGKDTTSHSGLRLRTKGYIDVLPNKRYKLTSNIQKVFVFYYTVDGEYLHEYSGWQQMPYTFQTGARTGKIRVLLAFTNNEPITVADFGYLVLEDISDNSPANRVYIPNSEI